jgi:hypothetical protein
VREEDRLVVVGPPGRDQRVLDGRLLRELDRDVTRAEVRVDVS